MRELFRRATTSGRFLADPRKPPPAPPDWPDQADKDYERVRVLGTGAFGEVWLARSRDKDAAYVAIKGVSVRNENEGATAAREIAILGALHHPNIVALCHDYAPVSPEAKGRYMALSYVDGQDLGRLLEKRGSLGLPLAQKVAGDLVAALAYCHARGVMHRDVKPDNVLLSGCKKGGKWLDDHEIWDDAKLKDPGRFKAILADFGFARATSAKDYEQGEGGAQGARMQRHKSRVLLQRKSAVGTRHFAAPEILDSLCEKKASDMSLSPCVSSYGLIVDAYAVGATLSEVLTGVPPGERDAESYVNENRTTTPKRKPTKFPGLNKMNPRRRSSAGDYDIQLRHVHELPAAAADLITQLMKEDTEERMSVREAQEHEWVGGYDALPHGDVPSRPEDPMVFIDEEAAHC